MSDQRQSSGSKRANDPDKPPDKPTRKPGTASSEELRLLMKMTGLAFQFGTEIIAGVLLGWGFDKLFGTQPWGVLIGSLAGIAVATLDLLRKAIQMNRQMDAAPGPPAPGSPGSPGSARTRGGPRSPLDLSGKRTGTKPSTPGSRDTTAEIEKDEDELDHERWKAAKDEELDLNDGDDARDETDGRT
jgi:ATP synthase protein I